MNRLWSFARRDTRARRVVLLLSLLVVENIWFFGGHYAGTVTFPYDFSATYHAVPFYWQGAVGSGEFPHWVAHQAFGYPLALNLQSGLFYPPLWLFPIAGIAYSTRVAAILQCLHILAGGLGAFVFARTRRISFAAALIAGFAFQAFGGFFCNAQHLDIVRGYALTPWLFAALTLDGQNVGWRRTWLLVLVVYLFMTGVYPGQAIACLAFGFGYLALQLAEARINRLHVSSMARAALWRVGAIVFGLGMSALSVLPGWLQRDEVSRVDEVGQLALTTANVDSIFTTLFRYDYARLSGDLSMRSLFITVPVLFGVFLLQRRSLREHCSLALMALVAGVMISGGVVFSAITRLIPMLGYSRFPIADYRALVALPLVLLGAHGLHTLFENRDRRVTLAAAIALFGGFIVLGGYRQHWFSFDARFVCIFLTAVGLAIATVVRRVPSWLLVACVFPLCLFDANRMHTAVTDPWRGAPEHLPFKRFARELRSAVGQDVVARPARARARYQLESQAPDLEGYLQGRYTADDYAASEHLRTIIAIRSSPDLTTYLTQASAPRLVPLATANATAALRSPETGPVAAVHYWREHIEYRTSASAESILIENEPQFRGWTGFLDCNPDREQSPIQTFWPLRAWRVPAGDHRFCVRFSTPGFGLAVTISGICFLLWIAGGGWLVWKRRGSRSGTGV